MNDMKRKTPFRKGDFIGQKYEIFDVLGEGGFGIVYLVYSHETQSAYALKTFRDEYIEDIKIRERFRKEAHVWIDLERHPYLVRAYFVEEISGRLYIAMEYISSDEPGLNTLEGYLRRKPPDLAQSLRWAIQFCRGMEHAYSKGIKVHRDIKPANIMIDQNKTVKISDFGLAGVLLESSVSDQSILAGKVGINTSMQTAIGTSIGTPEYMPPEQFTNFSVCDERSDIYSFGIVLYQMASGGTLPFNTDNPDYRWTALKYFHHETPVPKLNSPLFPIILKCLEKESQKRYQSFKDLRPDIEIILKRQTGEIVTLPKKEEMDSREWNNKGISLRNISRYQEAIDCYDRAIKIDPMNAGAWSNKGVALDGIGKFQEAIDCYEKALKINPSHAGAWLNKGMALRSLCRYQEEMECYSRTLSINPSLAAAWHNKAVCLEEHLGKFQEAIRCYDKALEIDPSSDQTWYKKGVLFSKLEKVNEALQSFNRVLDINPIDLDALYYKGALLMKLNRLAEAKPIYEKFIERDPACSDVWFNLASIYEHNKQFKEAIHCHKEVLKINPKDEESLKMIVQLHIKMQDKLGALYYCDKLIEASKSGAHLANKARILSFFGEYENAITLVKDILREWPEADLLWYTLAEIHERHKNYSEALKAAMKCREILLGSQNPDRQNLMDVESKIQVLKNIADHTMITCSQSSVGQDRNTVESEYGKPIEERQTRDGEMACLYRTFVFGIECQVIIYYISGVCHEECIELPNAAAFSEDFIKLWLTRNADKSSSAHQWQSCLNAPQGVRMWIRKEDKLTFVAAEYRNDGTRFHMSISSEKRYK